MCQRWISRAGIQRGVHCKAPTAIHLAHTIQTHTRPSNSSVGGKGCNGLLALHVAIQHFRAIPVCTLCEYPLYRLPVMPGSDGAYKL